MSDPITLTERPELEALIAAAVVVAKAMSPEARAAMMEAQRQSWVRGEQGLRAPESASPPRVPVSSAHPGREGVQSGPGQPIDICERLDNLAQQGHRIGYPTCDDIAEAAAEIRRLRAESESRYRAGIEAAARYHDAKAIRAENRQAFDTARRHNADAAAIRALADTPPADEMELRPEVAAFARLMERELRTNDARRGAEGWKGMTAAELLRMLDADAAKLRFALGAGDATKAIEQCADVANMAMMIADVTEIAARKGG